MGRGNSTTAEVANTTNQRARPISSVTRLCAEAEQEVQPDLSDGTMRADDIEHRNVRQGQLTDER